MKRLLFLCTGLVISVLTTFGQEVPKLKVTENDMNMVIFRCAGENETVVEVQSNIPLTFESTMDKEVIFCDTREENGFFIYELLFSTDKRYNGRRLKITSYGFDTHIQSLVLKDRVPVRLLVINETKFIADDLFNEGKFNEALMEYEKLYSINPNDAYVKRRIDLCNDKINGSSQTEIQGSRVAIQRFSNETAYARGIFYDKENDPIGKQATTILSTKLASLGQFRLMEWSKNQEEWQIADYRRSGTDFLIAGTITEFGRKNITEKKRRYQVVQTSISIRLIAVSNGQIVYAGEAKGEARTDGQKTDYDTTLNDKAISDAISKLIKNMSNYLM